MKDRISVRQICFILIAYNAILKLIIYPASAASVNGNDLIFPALFDLAVQTAVVWSVAFLCSKTDKTLFGLLETTFNKTAARVFYALFALYFLFAAIVPMNEEELFVHATFYDTVPSLYAFLPFFIFSVYAGAKSFTNAGRCADICLPIFLAGIIALAAMSVGEGDYSNLLPVLRQPFSGLARGALGSLFRYSESAFLLLFMGHFKYKKGDAAKLTLSYACGGLIVVALMAVFYAVYGTMTVTRPFILNDISAFFSAISYVGRIDLPLIYALDTVVLFAIVLYIQACVHCLSLAFGWDKRSALSLGVNVVLVAVTFILNNRYSQLYEAAAKWFWIPVLIFAYAVPLCAWALKGRER